MLILYFLFAIPCLYIIYRSYIATYNRGYSEGLWTYYQLRREGKHQKLDEQCDKLYDQYYK